MINVVFTDYYYEFIYIPMFSIFLIYTMFLRIYYVSFIENSNSRDISVDKPPINLNLFLPPPAPYKD